MNISKVPMHRLPGIRGFTRRASMFRPLGGPSAPTAAELVVTAIEDFRDGRLRPGQEFPTPETLSQITGAPLATSLEAVSTLLGHGLLRQQSSGKLSIAPHPAC